MLSAHFQSSSATVRSSHGDVIDIVTLAQAVPSTPPRQLKDVAATDELGFYEADDTSLRAFVSDSPSRPHTRPKTQVDLVLPPLRAFIDPDGE